MMRPELHWQSIWVATKDVELESLNDLNCVDDIIRAAETGEECNTAACVAGWAALLAAPQGSSLLNGDIITQTKRVYNICDYATDALGIDSYIAYWLFMASNTHEQVLWALKWLPDHQDATVDDLADAWEEEWTDLQR